MWKEAVSLAAAAGAACVLRSEYEKKHFSVEVTEIISPKLEKDRNLVFLSDLHNNEFGRGQRGIGGGDSPSASGRGIIRRRHDGLQGKAGREGSPLKLFRQLAASYPVYCGNGNHENRIVWERSLYGGTFTRSTGMP